MRRAHILLLAGLGLLAAGCHTDMWSQPKVTPMDKSDFFADGLASRPKVPGTVARGQMQDDEAFFTGYEAGKMVSQMPPRAYAAFAENSELVKRYGSVERAILKRGEERFNIVCSNCHGRLGDGKGMIAARGFAVRRPVANFHTDRLRKMPDGHFYDVIAHGFGTMYSMAARVPEVEDRWAIVAYIRALQLSQHAPAAQLAQEDLLKAQEAAR